MPKPAKARPLHRDQLFAEGPQRRFAGAQLLQIAMPLGGLGAGSVCLNGIGGLQDFAVRHQPATSAVPDGSLNGDAAFALLHVKDHHPKGQRTFTKLVEGPMPKEKIYAFGTKGQGFIQGGFEGLPRFAEAAFLGEYPFGTVTLSDPDLPLGVTIRGYNPFIPLDAVNSGIPCAILEYRIENRSRRRVDFEFSYHLSHLAGGSSRDPRKLTRNSVIPGGVYLHNAEPDESPSKGSAALVAVGHRPRVKAMWFRGDWCDSISALWSEVSTGRFATNRGHDAATYAGRNGGSILLQGSLGAGQSVSYPIVVAWHFPNANYEVKALHQVGCCDARWRPYYTTQWADAAEVAAYVRRHYASLEARTEAFHAALFQSTLPSYVLDAVSANLAILKSPTLLRQASGTVWAWEGCFASVGCCFGTCTHVWNYAQALPHLFPELERTLRETELLRSMDPRGHVTFRAVLPEGPADHGFHAAADGQLGGILKLHRDWHISGDKAWLARLYPPAKQSLEYSITTWDPRERGVLEEPHHNTYDIEFWGPDGMCTSIYLGALSAMAELAQELDRTQDAARYATLAQRGARYADQHLWNGQYYFQQVAYRGSKDQGFAQLVDGVTAQSGAVEKLLKKEGPKYQFATGCISDGVIGAWMATLYGVPHPMTRARVRRNLQAIFEYNFRHDLTDHANTQRPGYAWGNEAGLLLCSWPKGGKPTLPFVYSDEVWTGIEYQVASHSIAMGLVDQGLTLVKAARARYDGHTRNPWNEYECGNYYARAMASYALLASLSGFRYSRAKKQLWFGPKLDRDPFTTFFSTATGFGTLTWSRGALPSVRRRTAKVKTPSAKAPVGTLTLAMIEGELVLERVTVTVASKVHDKPVSLVATPRQRLRIDVP